MGFDATLGFVVNIGRPGVAGRLLPAGRPRRPWHRRGHRRAAAGASRTATSGPTSPSLAFPREALVRQTIEVLAAERPAPEHARAGDVRRAQPHPAGDDAQGARRRRRGPAGARRLGGDRSRVGLRRRSATTGSPRPASASSRRCSTTSTPTAAGCASCASSSTTRRPPTAGAATTAAASRSRPTSPTPALAGGRRPAGPAGRGGRAAQDVADRAGQPRHRPQGQDRRRVPRRGAPSPGSPTSATARRCATCSGRMPPTGRCRCRWSRR